MSYNAKVYLGAKGSGFICGLHSRFPGYAVASAIGAKELAFVLCL